MPTASIASVLAKIPEKLVGKAVARPIGTLAGHAAGLPFEDVVHVELVAAFPERAYRHYELLNEMYRSHPAVTTPAERRCLLGPPALQHLLARSTRATGGWDPERQFDAKQDDTAESVILPTHSLDLSQSGIHPVHLIDVKTHNSAKTAQPPNIISAKKVARACAHVLKSTPSAVPFDINYVCIKWEEEDSRLVCKEASVVVLLRIPPEKIYINWAAATQIQFTPSEVPQDYSGTPLQWVQEFIQRFCVSLARQVTRQTRDLEEYRALLSESQKS